MKKCLILVLIMTVVSLFISNAHAFGRRIIRSRGGCSSCYTSCYTPVAEVAVAVPVLAYPVLVPAFQFQYVQQTCYAAAPVVAVTGYPVASPIIQPVVSGGYGMPNGYAQPQQNGYAQPQQNGYAQPQQNFGLSNKDKIHELAKALLEEMNRMAGDGPLDSGPPVVPGTLQQQPQQGNNFHQPQQQPQMNYGQQGNNFHQGNNSFFHQPQQQQTNLAQVSIAAMSRTCAQCHTGIGSKADMVIFKQPGLINEHANWKKIKDELVSGRMPPKDVHFQLSLQERQWITQWLTINNVN